MAKVAIVYWSGSGNTEAMAQAVEEGAKAAGAETTLSFVSDTTAADVAAFDTGDLPKYRLAWVRTELR